MYLIKLISKRLENVRTGKVFQKEAVIKWGCRNCGYAHEMNANENGLSKTSGVYGMTFIRLSFFKRWASPPGT